MLVAFAMSLSASAIRDWLASKYGSLKSTLSARSGVDGDLGHVPVERLGSGLEGDLEHGVRDPVHLLRGEAQGRGDRPRDRGLVPLL